MFSDDPTRFYYDFKVVAETTSPNVIYVSVPKGLESRVVEILGKEDWVARVESWSTRVVITIASGIRFFDKNNSYGQYLSDKQEQYCFRFVEQEVNHILSTLSE